VIPAPQHQGEVARVIALLDAAHTLGAYCQVSVFANRFADGVAEYAVRLWAGAHDYNVREIDLGDEGGRCFAIDAAAAYVTLHVERAAAPREPANDETEIHRFTLLEID
jgi:metallophosphoesterase superfamily enzyme